MRTPNDADDTGLRHLRPTLSRRTLSQKPSLGLDSHSFPPLTSTITTHDFFPPTRSWDKSLGGPAGRPHQYPTPGAGTTFEDPVEVVQKTLEKEMDSLTILLLARQLQQDTTWRPLALLDKGFISTKNEGFASSAGDTALFAFVQPGDTLDDFSHSFWQRQALFIEINDMDTCCDICSRLCVVSSTTTLYSRRLSPILPNPRRTHKPSMEAAGPMPSGSATSLTLNLTVSSPGAFRIDPKILSMSCWRICLCPGDPEQHHRARSVAERDDTVGSGGRELSFGSGRAVQGRATEACGNGGRYFEPLPLVMETDFVSSPSDPTRHLGTSAHPGALALVRRVIRGSEPDTRIRVAPECGTRVRHQLAGVLPPASVHHPCMVAKHPRAMARGRSAEHETAGGDGERRTVVEVEERVMVVKVTVIRLRLWCLVSVVALFPWRRLCVVSWSMNADSKLSIGAVVADMQSSDAAVVADLKSSDAVGDGESENVRQMPDHTLTRTFGWRPEKYRKNSEKMRVLGGCWRVSEHGYSRPKPDTRTRVPTRAHTLPGTGIHSTPG
ncbi:hypothetical protein BDZ89DRAFT_1200221, partial [Hymenopellis radicata]